MDEIVNKKERLLEIIKKDVIVPGTQQIAMNSNGILSGKNSWLLDFRSIFLNPEALELIVEIFWHHFERDYPFQVGGQEVAAIPLVSAIVLHSQKIGRPVNGFFIRKGRKPTGLQKIIEGKLNDEKIILVDDLTNSGTTLLRQIKVLKYAEKKVTKAFVLVSFEKKNRDILTQEGLDLFSLYSLTDIGLSSFYQESDKPTQVFKNIWRFQSPGPNFFLRVDKSSPCLDEKKIYFGADNGSLWALNQEDGSIAWEFKETGYAAGPGKKILSSPVIHKDTVYFGAYDGNVYAINKNTGRLRWKNMDADFIGSSPAVAADLGLLFIGLEFGLFQKRGGLAALDLETGKKIWDFRMTDYIHCSPAYCPEKKVVAIGCNNFYVYLFEAKSGKLKWKFRTDGEMKASLVFDIKHNLLIFGSFDSNMYALDIDTGEVKGKFKTKNVIYSTPLVYGNNVYFGSMDKHLYSVNLDTGKLNWHTDCNSRLFAQPQLIEGKLYIGGTGGIMFEIDPKNGEKTGSFITTERITNKVVYNPKTKRFFLPTYANEIYCIEKTDNLKSV